MTALGETTPLAPTPTALLRTLVLCDLADSTALIERLGDRAAAALIRSHDRLARDLVATHGGREIDKTDGFLLVFERPIQAVAFALDYQRQLAELSAREQLPLSARVGIHVGDVVVWDNESGDVDRGAKRTELEGMAKPVTARLAQLALPGQVLLSGTVYDIARRAQGELGSKLDKVRWLAHGRYAFKGVPDPVPVFEIGEEGIAPLKPPPWSSKAHREIPFWRRPTVLGTEVLLLLAVILVPVFYLLRPQPAIAFANRDWVVVGDLHNLTGETKFDDSLQAAFRIALEQSRYVNVIPDLKTRETLKLMQRDPETTAVDRSVGSEIALRDGARALILPSIAEIGGRVRVTAEVVDPKTQATVFAESADGLGEASVLPSLDRVNQKLRIRLGEALAAVSENSRPLDRATTANLDALRAFSLGRRAYYAYNLKEALALEQQALALDPDFALARTTIAAIYYNVGNFELAQREIERAAATRERLSARDALFVDAWKAQFGPPLPAIEKWRALARIYPDFSIASGSVGYYSWQQNLFADAKQAMSASITPGTPHQGWIESMLGILELGSEHYDAAEKHLESARRMGLDAVENRFAAYAARRQFDKIDLNRLKQDPKDLRGQDATTQNARLALTLDQGKWADVWPLLAEQKAAVPTAQVRTARKLETIELGLRSLLSASGAGDMAALRGFIRTVEAGFDKETPIDRSDAAFQLMFAAYLAAHAGDTHLAEETLRKLGPTWASPDYPVLSRLHVAAKAELARRSGKPDDALHLLRAQPIDDSALCLNHVVLMDALADSGDAKAARAQAKWLASHRGRAYAEFNGDWMLRPYNVAQSTLALLRSAELAAGSGDLAAARSDLESFTSAWPQTSTESGLAKRIAALRARLKSATP